MAFDLKAATPSDTLPTDGYLIGADTQSDASPSIYTALAVAGCILGATCMTGDTITTDLKLIDHAVTWNAGGVTFTGWKLNVTNTASGAGSLLVDVQVDGTTIASIRKEGLLTLNGESSVGALIQSTAPFRTGAIGIGHNVMGGSGFVVGSSTSNFFGAWGVNGILLTASTTLQFASGGTSSGDLVLARDAANVLAQRNSTNAQTFRIYNTYTDAANYERFKIGWASNILEIGTEEAGTGSVRETRFLVSGTRKVTFYQGPGRYLEIFNDGTSSYVQDPTVGLVLSGVFGVTLGPSATEGVVFTSGSMTVGRNAGHFSVSFGALFADTDAGDITLTANNAYSSASTNITGGNVTLIAGNGSSGSAGNAHGGDVVLTAGTGYGTGHNGYIKMTNLPTSASGLPTGALWNNSGVINIA